ncbi:MAG: Hsp20/alpha crystallin family protein [Chthoniobacter sp.]|uniref:Hsp20/alpha crystallin family protein n=1 Tax=Chthoniobacter sp. TaxID=2510640 RepID=UPI0032A8D9A1
MNTTLNKPASESCATPNGANRASYVTPLANVLETKDGYVLEAELPGVGKDGVELTVENGELTIVGRRAVVENRGREVYRESRVRDFRRTFELDPSIDATNITAKVDQGVLRLHLPKAEALKPRKITVG